MESKPKNAYTSDLNKWSLQSLYDTDVGAILENVLII